MSVVLKRLTARRDKDDGLFRIWAAYSAVKVRTPIVKKEYDNLSDDEVAVLLQQLYLPKRNWYWKLWKYQVPRGTNVRLLRVSLKQNERGELLTWEEGFDAFILYARML